MSVARRQDVEKTLPLGVMKVNQIQDIKAGEAQSVSELARRLGRARLPLVTKVTDKLRGYLLGVSRYQLLQAQVLAEVDQSISITLFHL